jgi:glycosyltransferase involved in cell wall biosynthesis
MRQLGLRRPLLWLNPYSAGHLIGKLDECAVLYDITDDWALASCSAREKQMIDEQDHWLCRKADLVVVCSEALARSREQIAKRLLLLPNGVDVEHYSRMSGGQLTRNPLWSSPVFGYTGTLHDDRIDIDLVLNLAQAYPHGSVVLVGPDNLSAAARQRLLTAPNVFLPGPVPYANLPEHMTAFDVCIVPHRETAFTESLNPIKLWEYLACGKPIVSTNVAGFRDYAHLCSVASGPKAFIAACSGALRDGGRGREKRTLEAGRHTWEARVDQLLANLRPLGVMG